MLVYAPGCWDLLHVGHLEFLEAARALGDRLAVGVASDEVICADKGRKPVIPLPDRLRMLRSLRCVDLALPYYALDFLPHLEALRPAILAVGEEWGGAQRHDDAELWARNVGCRVARLPYWRGESTSAIRERVKDD